MQTTENGDTIFEVRLNMAKKIRAEVAIPITLSFCISYLTFLDALKLKYLKKTFSVTWRKLFF